MSGLDAAERACAVADRSDLGRLTGTGPDLLGLLHRLSTGDVKDLAPGEGRATVLTNAKGRIVERLSAHHLGPDGVLLIAGAGSASRVLAHLRKFTFAEDTGLADTTESTFAYALIGPRWPEAAKTAGIPELAPYGAGAYTLAGARVQALRTNGFDGDGLMLVGPRDSAGPVLSALADAAAAVGGASIDPHGLEAWRILKGLPASGHELTEDHNPLEAGLRDAVSFTKGCYVGQEVVARLNTYGKVSSALVRLTLSAGAPVPSGGAAVAAGGSPVGTVTSAILPEGREAPVALAYVKTRGIAAPNTPLTIEIDGVPYPVAIVGL